MYLIVLGLYVSDYFAPVGRLIGHLPENTFFGIVRVVVVHFDNLVFDFGEFVVQVGESFGVLLNFFLADPFVDGPGYFFDEPELEEVLNDVEALLQNVLVLSIVIELPLLLGQAGLLPIIHNKVIKNPSTLYCQ